MSIVGVWLGGIILALLSVPVVLFSKRRFEECLPISTIFMILFLFLLGVFHALKAAVYAVTVLSVLLSAGALLYFSRRGGLKAQTANIFTPGFFVFIVFTLCLPVICGRLRLWAWDEFIHWGLAAKDMYTFDAMGYRADSYLTMWGVPPFITLFEYFFLKLCGAYSESTLYAAQNLMTVILLLPVYRWITGKKWVYAVPTAALFFCLPLIFYSDYWLSLYTDCLMGIGLAYAVSAYFCSKDKGVFELISASLGVCFVVMLKNMGLEYAVIPVTLIGADFLFLQKREKKPTNPRQHKPFRCVAVVLLCLVLAFSPKLILDAAMYANGKTSTELAVVMKLWNAVSGASDKEQTADTGAAETAAEPEAFAAVNLAAASESDEGTGDESVSSDDTTALQEVEETILPGFLKDYQISGLKAFLHFWNKDNTVPFGFLEVSYWTLYFFLAAAGLLVIRLLRNEPDIRSVRLCVWGILIGFWFYALLTAAGILLVFTARQASILQDFDRYMKSYYLASFLVFLLLLLQRLDERKNICLTLSLLCFSATAVSPQELVVDAAGLHRSVRIEADTVTETLSALDPDTDRVAFISQSSGGMEYYCTKYYALPLRVERCIGWSFAGDEGTADDIHVSTTAEEWSRALSGSGFTHVYIYHTDDYFNSAFASLFADPDGIADNTLYEIVKTDGGIRLEECR